MKSVRLLQALAQYPNHLQEQPQKALVDILSEVRTYLMGPWVAPLVIETRRRHELTCRNILEQHCPIEKQLCNLAFC